MVSGPVRYHARGARGDDDDGEIRAVVTLTDVSSLCPRTSAAEASEIPCDDDDL
jgi:hypothetical protein